ncbi:MAG: hypothetical protein LBR74_06185 [Eubacterium sp.]|jgi:hypothetical protein|nr:hypothetical protein [Eubacterium sp.]
MSQKQTPRCGSTEAFKIGATIKQLSLYNIILQNVAPVKEYEKNRRRIMFSTKVQEAMTEFG